jgi:hypothetical protein
MDAKVTLNISSSPVNNAAAEQYTWAFKLLKVNNPAKIKTNFDVCNFALKKEV